LPLILLLILSFDQAKSCSCVRKDAAWTFERADFVSRVLVEKVQTIIDDGRVLEMIYTVKHLDVYKSLDAPKVLPTQVRTAGDPGTCGVHLVKGQEIVIAGPVSPSFLRIELCTHGIIDRADAERLRSK
ncbi:hypothetical protein PENTCL1PPCAC_659, partial [Pristionchus entomophagus]